MDKDCYNKKNVLLDHLQNDVSFREKLVFLQKQKLEKRNSKKKMVQESIKGCTSKHKYPTCRPCSRSMRAMNVRELLTSLRSGGKPLAGVRRLLYSLGI